MLEGDKMNRYFTEIKQNFGFGCMRLPTVDDNIDTAEFSKMVDYFIESGFNYFDTAHGYHSGKSEPAIKECLTSRYPRDAYVLTDKLSGFFLKSAEDIIPLFNSQLEACGVDYFDFYLMHAQNKTNFETFKEMHAYETVLELKKQGKIKHFGISFHDKADVLDRILTEYPQIEVVQIQFNYIDYDSVSVESKKCYDVCRRHNKPVIVMEPVKGGSLVKLPDDAKKVLGDLNGGSTASYALRFAAGFDGIMMVLSGMGNMDMMRDNVSSMREYKPLTEEETCAIEKVRAIIKGQDMIPCTACRYCTDGCPMGIPIPDLFSCMNAKNTFHNWNSSFYYEKHTESGGKASECIECGQCESVCPQQLKIRDLLKQVAKTFEK